MRYSILAAIGACILLVPDSLTAQDNMRSDAERWQIQTESGDYIWDIRLLKLSGDTLLFRQADTVGRAPVDKIRELRLIRKTVVHGGGGEGGGAAAVLTGADDEIYDLGPLDFAARLRAIQQVFLVHPSSP